MEPILRVRNLKTFFYTPKGILAAVNDVSFDINKGEGFGLIGESGCGKSTTAYSIARLLKPPGQVVGGQIILDGDDILKMSPEKLRTIRGRKYFMVFQDPMNCLNPILTIRKQIEEVIINSQNQTLTKKEILEMSRDAMRQCDLPDITLSLYPHQLSGGMRQRVMIAMGVAFNSKFLLLDEPTTALDATIQFKMIELIKNIQNKNKLSFLLVTHNIGVAAKLCKNIAVMYAGKIVEKSLYEEILKKPLHPYTKGLFECIIKTSDRREYLKTIEGYLPNLILPPEGCLFANRCSESQEVCRREKPQIKSIDNNHSVSCHLYS